MRLPTGIAATELGRIADALRAAEEAVAGVLSATIAAAGWSERSALPAVTLEVTETTALGGHTGAHDRHLEISADIVATFANRGQIGQNRHDAQAAAIYLPHVIDAATFAPLAEAGADLRITGHRLYTNEARTQTILTFTAIIRIVVQVADLAEE